LGSACVASARRTAGRIRRGEPAGERVLAIANFAAVLYYSHGVALRKDCFGTTPKPSRRDDRYPESAVSEDVEVAVSAVDCGAFGKWRVRNSSTFGNSSRFRSPK
jgi:hypothetical protein